MKQYERYKPSGVEWIGEIPEHWGLKKLKWVTRLLYGESLKSEARQTGDVPVYGSNGIVGYHSEAITTAPCLIIGRKGSHGKINYSESSCFPIDTTYYIDANTTRNNLRWLFYILSMLNLDALSKDSAVPGLSREEAYERTLPVPALIAEQTAIAAYLDRKTAEIDGLIAKKQRLIELLNEEKTAIINHAVTKGLNPDAPMKDSGVPWLGQIPEHWSVEKSKYAFDFFDHMRIPLSSEERSRMIERTYDYYGASGIIDKVENYIFEGDYILLGEDGANLLTRSSPLAFKATGKFWVNNHAHILRPKTGNIDYYVSLLEAIDYTIWVTGAAQPKLTAENLSDIALIRPPAFEQAEIAKFINRQCWHINGVVGGITREMQLLQEYRTALISEAVTGRICVVETQNFASLQDGEIRTIDCHEDT